MNNGERFGRYLRLLIALFYTFASYLALMSGARMYLYVRYAQTSPVLDVASMLWTGIRLDASVLAYGFAPIVLVVVVAYLLRIRLLDRIVLRYTFWYCVGLFVILTLAYMSDYIYFSFFGEHATITIFGVLDDDTYALWQTALKNYNVAAFVLSVIVAIVAVSMVVWFFFRNIEAAKPVHWGVWRQSALLLSVIVAVAFLARGTLGIFPLYRYTPDATTDRFLNMLAQTPTFMLMHAYESYEKSKNDRYDLIAQTGYKGKIEEALFVVTAKRPQKGEDILQTLQKTTPHDEQLTRRPPHVVVVMMESFGLSILRYQSETFDIMGNLRKHFQEDTLFTYFESAANGTIASLEPLLLNIPALPGYTPFGQGIFQNTAFSQAAARVYERAGYETSFVYGGELSWRNIGHFIAKQGFRHLYGANAIARDLGEDKRKISHDWGVFDEYLYRFVYRKLHNATTPQFIFVLTTNNHPPFTIPKTYRSKIRSIGADLRRHIKGDTELAKKRFIDYAYALDCAGTFLNDIKNSSLAKRCVVAITADNNTVEGIMRYDSFEEESKLIPFYLYMPPYIAKKHAFDTSVPASHKDLFPTLYNITLSDASYTALGTNLEDKGVLHCGFNVSGILLSEDGAFWAKKPKTPKQRACAKNYKATLALAWYLIRSHKGKR